MTKHPWQRSPAQRWDTCTRLSEGRGRFVLSRWLEREERTEPRTLKLRYFIH